MGWEGVLEDPEKKPSSGVVGQVDPTGGPSGVWDSTSKGYERSLHVEPPHVWKAGLNWVHLVSRVLSLVVECPPTIHPYGAHNTLGLGGAVETRTPVPPVTRTAGHTRCPTDGTKKTQKVVEEGQKEDETPVIAYVLTHEEFDKQLKFHNSQAQGNIEEMPIHSSVEENTSESELQVEESKVESSIVGGSEINNEIQKAEGTDHSSEPIIQEGLKNKTNIDSSDSEDDDKLHVTHRYPTRSC
ncbi:hypothetical protein JTB14_001139 [Gonioctena quinquepunctata]|nr:hypothetical protein JTB14_001139 [Gonioctena quinquepunctata]